MGSNLKTYRLDDVLLDRILIYIFPKTESDIGLAGGDFGIYRYGGKLGYNFRTGGQEVDSDFIVQDFGWSLTYYKSFRNAINIWSYK